MESELGGIEDANVVPTTPKSAAKMSFMSTATIETIVLFVHCHHIYALSISPSPVDPSMLRGVFVGQVVTIAEGAVAEAAERWT